MGTHLTEYGIGWMPRTVKSGLQILLAAKRKRENSFTERKTIPGKTKPPLSLLPSLLPWPGRTQHAHNPVFGFL